MKHLNLVTKLISKGTFESLRKRTTDLISLRQPGTDFSFKSLRLELYGPPYRGGAAGPAGPVLAGPLFGRIIYS